MLDTISKPHAISHMIVFEDLNRSELGTLDNLDGPLDCDSLIVGERIVTCQSILRSWTQGPYQSVLIAHLDVLGPLRYVLGVRRLVGGCLLAILRLRVAGAISLSKR